MLITKNNIQKSYTANDLIMTSYDENMKNCKQNQCTIDLPEHFTIRVRHNKEDYVTLILRLFLNGEVIAQQSTSSPYQWIGITN